MPASKRASIVVYLLPEVKKWLLKEAKEHTRTTSNFVSHLVEQEMKKSQKRKKG